MRYSRYPQPVWEHMSSPAGGGVERVSEKPRVLPSGVLLLRVGLRFRTARAIAISTLLKTSPA